MKQPLYFLAVLGISSFCYSEQADNPTPPELLKLRKRYLDSLNLLRQKYVSESDTANAATVSREIEKVSHATPPVTTPNPVPEIKPEDFPAAVEDASPIGLWAWHHNATTVAINADGTVGRDHNQGKRRWIDVAERKYQIEWKNGFIDKVAVAKDGRTMRVVNNLGEGYTVRLIPEKTITRPQNGRRVLS